MHLHDRHGTHLTLPETLKQARQSLAARATERISEGFPYSLVQAVIPRGLVANIVSVSLQGVT